MKHIVNNIFSNIEIVCSVDIAASFCNMYNNIICLNVIWNLRCCKQSVYTIEQGRSQRVLPGGRPTPIECCLALLRTKNEQVQIFRLNFSWNISKMRFLIK